MFLIFTTKNSSMMLRRGCVEIMKKSVLRSNNVRTISTESASSLRSFCRPLSTLSAVTSGNQSKSIDHSAAILPAQALNEVPPLRCYHSSSILALPVRRRRHRTTSLEQKDRGDGITAAEAVTTQEIAEDDSRSSSSQSETDERAEIYDASPGTLTTHEFQTLGNALLDKLEKALHPMKAKNDPFVVTRFDGDIGQVLRLDLGPSLGIYQVEFSEEEQVFEYSSPISGKILYFYSTKKNEWIGVDDGNAFEGILVRDLIRQCQGLPDL